MRTSQKWCLHDQGEITWMNLTPCILLSHRHIGMSSFGWISPPVHLIIANKQIWLSASLNLFSYSIFPWGASSQSCKIAHLQNVDILTRNDINLWDEHVFFTRSKCSYLLSHLTSQSLCLLSRSMQSVNTPHPPARVISTDTRISFYMQGRYQYKYPNRKTDTYVYIV